MPLHSLTSDELRLLEDSQNSDVKTVNIRLREGEYQLDLVKTIASFELELHFPDVKDLTKKLYGETKTEDIQFIRKVQTILKKMEKSGVIKILPKRKPWDLQRYALSSFRFQDVEKNTVVLATESELKKTAELIRSSQNPEGKRRTVPNYRAVRILLPMLAVIASYAIILWTLTQPTASPIIFVLAFSIAAASSLFLGISIARKR